MINVFVVDMDETFLIDQKQSDKECSIKQYNQLKQLDFCFAVS